RLHELLVVAVVRAPDAERAIAAAEALSAGGVRAIEIAFTTPDAPSAIGEVVRRRPDLLVGAGTVMSTAQARAAVDAGAGFLVSPHCGDDVLAAAEALDVLAIP